MDADVSGLNLVYLVHVFRSEVQQCFETPIAPICSGWAGLRFLLGISITLESWKEHRGVTCRQRILDGRSKENVEPEPEFLEVQEQLHTLLDNGS